MSGFVAFEAKVVLETPLSFFRGEFFDSDGINIHGIGISFLLGMVVVVSIILERNEWVVPSFGNFVGPFPDLFEMEGLLVPFFHGGWYDVHGIDPSHKLGRDSSGEEIDQDVLISDSTEGGVVFEFRDVVEDVNFVVDFGGGQPSYGLFSGIFEDE